MVNFSFIGGLYGRKEGNGEKAMEDFSFAEEEGYCCENHYPLYEQSYCCYKVYNYRSSVEKLKMHMEKWAGAH